MCFFLKLRGATVVTLLLLTAGLAGCANAVVVEPGKEVHLEYTLRLEDDTEMESNVGGQPLVFRQGAGNIIRGLDQELLGMQVGDTKEIVVQPQDGYGLMKLELRQEVPLEQIPEEARQVGAQVSGADPTGRPIQARVLEVKEKTVLLDFNHPMAGKILKFSVTVLDIKE
jgi:FKBP-type peptidyl-prolyl cis-trans isomerase SlyD